MQRDEGLRRLGALGFTQNRAETLWEAARRQGKRVGSMLFPGADGKIAKVRVNMGPPRLTELSPTQGAPQRPMW